jgi:multicomponent K+:H+ antiporter subunit E
MLRKIFPHPLLSLLLVAVWLMLLNGVSLGGIVMGVILGIAIPKITSPYWPDRPRLRRPFKIAEYILLAIWDIVVANVVVAKLILFKRNADMSPAWIAVPLDLRTPEAITVLAGTVTLTPGTVSAEFSADGRELLVHALDAPDPDAVRDGIKARYERRLKEIFE